MPTIRSHFSFEQFEEVLQKLAHEIALDAVKNLNQGDVLIRISGPRLSRVEAGKIDRIDARATPLRGGFYPPVAVNRGGLM